MKKEWISQNSLQNLAAKYDVILFGQGIWAEKTMKKLPKKPLLIYDNNASYDQTYFQDVLITKPQNTVLPNTVVIVTTIAYEDVLKQMEAIGYETGKNLFCSPAIRNNKITSDIKTHQARLLFTCSDSIIDANDCGGGVYIYQTHTRKYEKIYSGRCEGVLYFNERYYIAEESRGVLVFGSDLRLQKTIEMHHRGSAIHGLALDTQKQYLYIANTALDLVSVYDLTTDTYVDDIYISYKNPQGVKYRHHINDLAFYNGILYVSMFSFSGAWQNGIYDGGVLMIDPQTKRAVGKAIENMWMPHSPTFIDDEFVICDSMRSDVYKTNNKVLAHLRGFIRGIAHDGTYYFIAQSEHRHFDRLRHLDQPIDINCGIHIFDEETKANHFHQFDKLSNIHALVVME